MICVLGELRSLLFLTFRQRSTCMVFANISAMTTMAAEASMQSHVHTIKTSCIKPVTQKILQSWLATDSRIVVVESKLIRNDLQTQCFSIVAYLEDLYFLLRRGFTNMVWKERNINIRWRWNTAYRITHINLTPV